MFHSLRNLIHAAQLANYIYWKSRLKSTENYVKIPIFMPKQTKKRKSKIIKLFGSNRER